MATPDLINIALIRCGRTEWDTSGRVVGRVDLPLASEEANGLTDLVVSLEGTGLSSVLHGPDQCCIATAEAVARETGGKLKRSPDLADVGMGLWEGLRRQELEEKFPSKFRAWTESPSDVSVPEGEPLDAATDRLVSSIGRLIDKLRKTDPGVGIVLRPMSYELVSAWITGRPAIDVTWSDESPRHEWHEVARSRFQAWARGTREGASVGG
ncbi:MAG: histidine phosphatase family protein [Planctomycetota bacterium]